MTANRLTTTSEIFKSRLTTLAKLLETAEKQRSEAGKGVDDIMSARLAEDMLPFSYQVVFACNQPNELAAWCTDKPHAMPDSSVLSYADLKAHIAETLARLDDCAPCLTDDRLEQIKRIDLQGGLFLELPGLSYTDDFLTPNFYFHMVTTYALLRMCGVEVGKHDYMAHLLPHLQQS